METTIYHLVLWILVACEHTAAQPDIPIHGGYTQWSRWSHCSKPCDWGNQYRSRTCTNPPPANKGRGCLGEDIQSRWCNSHRCPVHGGYSQWSVWSQCSQSCGPGIKRRYRSCTNPRPAYGGRWCSHLAPWRESQKCNVRSCPVINAERCQDYASSGMCTEWKRKGYCKSVKIAQIECARTCGRCKQGSSIDGGYMQWSLWSLCSKPCGGGTQIRNRSCSNPPPTNGGKGCSGQGRAKQSRRCNKFSCSVCRNSLDDGYCNKKKKSCSNNSEFRQYCKLTCEVCSVPVQSVLSSIQSPKN